MGADENDQAKLDAFGTPLSESIEEKLDLGWRILSLPDGQLLLSPPLTYGEPPAAA